ncbi:hypothetical protein PoB_001632600 [Plakobranchus ocellatus]|uniref:Uncharacterized protein n=1 Tax=Plakobranchus ocellatus TaxID=259542 RepID=A0AAV3Z1V2_9GAST|nr:hypothetical protein PoB_001632600 [Plakobranchus ocellatus]
MSASPCESLNKESVVQILTKASCKSAFSGRQTDSRVFLAAANLTLESFRFRVSPACYTGLGFSCIFGQDLWIEGNPFIYTVVIVNKTNKVQDANKVEEKSTLVKDHDSAKVFCHQYAALGFFQQDDTEKHFAHFRMSAGCHYYITAEDVANTHAIDTAKLLSECGEIDVSTLESLHQCYLCEKCPTDE